ncbi:MAG: hypothetical protein ACREP7_07280, partial [Lysobacter sp.]
RHWIPAFAGMTGRKDSPCSLLLQRARYLGRASGVSQQNERGISAATSLATIATKLAQNRIGRRRG